MKRKRGELSFCQKLAYDLDEADYYLSPAYYQCLTDYRKKCARRAKLHGALST